MRTAAAAIAAAAFSAPVSAADTTHYDNAVNLLLPFTTLNSTAIGQQTLYANLFGTEGTVAINNNATAAQRQQAVYDNYMINQTQTLSDGLGTKITGVITAAVTATTPGLTSLTTLINSAAAISGADSATAKTFFGNGTGTTTATLPSNGTFGVYDAYYKTIISPFASTNSAGNSRPFQVLGFDSTSHATIDSFQGTWNGTTVTNVSIASTVTSNAAAPSGHTTWGYTEALLYAMLVPERYTEMLTRGSEYGNSRLVLGVHYPLDVIMGRALATYDAAQMLNNNAAYMTNGTVNFQTLFTTARSDLTNALTTSCGGVSDCIASSTSDRFSNAAQNQADYAARLTYGMPTLSYSAAPREAAPAGGPDASILLATVYGGSTTAAKAIGFGVNSTSGNAIGLYGSLSTDTINQIIVSTEGQALAAFYGTSLSYWTRINLYDAADYFTNANGVTGSVLLAKGDTLTIPVTVANGGVFGGAGTVNGNLTINSGGALGAQGDGTTSHTAFTVNGTTNFATGSKVQLTGVFLPGTTYTLLNSTAIDYNGQNVTAANPLNVALDTSTNSNLMTLYTGKFSVAGDPQLQVTLQSHFASVAETANEKAVAAAIDAAGNAGGFGANGATFLSNLISNNTVATAPAAFNALSGEGLTGAQNAALNAGSLFVTTVLGQATFWGDDRSNDIFGMKDGGAKDAPACSMKDGSDCPVPSRARLWAAGFGQYAQLDAQNGTARQTGNNSGVATGMDYEVSQNVILGVSGGYSDSTFSVKDLGTNGTVEGGHIGAYGAAHYGDFYVAGVFDYANYDNKTTRSVIGLGAIQSEKGKFSSDEWLGRFEAGYKWETNGATVTPFVGFQVATLSNDGFSETGLGGAIAGLNVASQDVDSDRSIIGVQFDTKVNAGSFAFTPYIRASWEHEFNPDRSIQASFVAIPQANFTVFGASAAEDLARINTGFKVDVTNTISAFAAFDGEFSDRGESYAGTGGLRIRW